jgi:hypothetical protein
MIRPTSGSRVSSAYLHDWRLGSQAFRDMAGWDDVRANLTGGGEPLEVLVDRVTTNFFEARVALGAQQHDVVRLVMQRGMLLIGTGLTVGSAAALALGRFVAGLLYSVTPTDPVTLLAVALFLAAVAILAAYLPARRAARVDPMVALRAE